MTSTTIIRAPSRKLHYIVNVTYTINLPRRRYTNQTQLRITATSTNDARGIALATIAHTFPTATNVKLTISQFGPTNR